MQTNVVIVRPVKKTPVVFRDFSSALSELVYRLSKNINYLERFA